MSYTRPDGDAADFEFTGGTYTRPDGASVDFSFELVAIEIEAIGDAYLGELTAAGAGVHGVSGTGAATPHELTAEGVGETAGTIEAIGDADLDALTVEGVGAHGVAGAGAATLGGMAAAGEGGHGVSGLAALALEIVVTAGIGSHGVAASGVATLSDLAAVGVANHPRYMLKGEVRDAGVLVNRTVRAYRRDTGELIGEQFTVVGRFTIHAGFAAREHYLVPLDLDDAATDWLPPTTNRVMSVLAED